MKSAHTAQRAMATPSPIKTLLIYALMLVASGAALRAMLSYGDTLSAGQVPAGIVQGHKPKAPQETLLHVLLALVVIIAASRGLGALFGFIRQPRVIGEVVAGILLGPSLLGQVWPAAQSYLLPDSVAPCARASRCSTAAATCCSAR